MSFSGEKSRWQCSSSFCLCCFQGFILSVFPLDCTYCLSFVLSSISWSFLSVLLAFLLFFMSSSEVVSLTFPAPLFSPLSYSCSSPPPRTSVCVTGERTVTVPRRSSPPLSPPIFFLPLPSFTDGVVLSLSLSHLPFSPTASLLHLHFILSTSSHFSPVLPPAFTFHCTSVLFLYIYITQTSVKLPLLPSHLSSVPLFLGLSNIWQHLLISLLCSLFFICVPCSSPDL